MINKKIDNENVKLIKDNINLIETFLNNEVPVEEFNDKFWEIYQNTNKISNIDKVVYDILYNFTDNNNSLIIGVEDYVPSGLYEEETNDINEEELRRRAKLILDNLKNIL